MTKNALCQHLRASKGTLESRVGSILVVFSCIMGPKRPEKRQGEPTNAIQKGVKTTQKMWIGGILDRLKVISIHSRSTSKRTKQKAGPQLAVENPKHATTPPSGAAGGRVVERPDAL